ncbi:GMC family oxidoreductase [Arenicella sp. 4NH20-0111]|uniref:GMC family oxidoreductase n=1 Tax=Arenicella sp. 4NH20-0111 TaxID=3127648 RepID=UPI003105DDB4
MQEHTYVNETKEEFDVLIVGSGITGGWAAKEFCERGFSTLMIERGRVVKHREDYTGEGKPVWDKPLRSRVKLDDVNENYRIQKQCYAFNDATKQFFGNDKDLPYSTEKGTDFSWIRANQLGGKSLLWHRQSYRLSDFDFEANVKDGHGNDWPIRYDDLEKWYDHVETFAGISGSKENLPQLPDSVYQPPHELTKPEQDFKDVINTHFENIRPIIGRCAHLTKPTELQISLGRVKCMSRNECQKGCSLGAYFSTQSSTLPAAANTGNLQIAPNSVVDSLIYDERTNRVKGVRVIDNDTLAEREYFAKVVFMCASTLGSTQILLNSKSKKFPRGIANSSGVLGHYLMDHNYNASIGGTLPGYEDEFYIGRRPTGMYIPNFYYKPSLYKSNFVRGYAFATSAFREDWRQMANKQGIGVDFKKKLKHAGQWRIHMMAQGEMLPRYENQVSLHPDKKDKWGIPQLHMNVQWSDNEREMMQDAVEVGTSMLKKAGVEDIYGSANDTPPGLAIHEVGTARMGKDPKDSVLNGYNQTHDIPNLFVTDGASFCSTAVQNPSLTFMALTVRAVDYAAKEFKAGRL